MWEQPGDGLEDLRDGMRDCSFEGIVQILTKLLVRIVTAIQLKR